jgi:integrase
VVEWRGEWRISHSVAAVKGGIEIKAPKTAGSRRVLPLSSTLLGMLDDRKRSHGHRSPWVFYQPDRPDLPRSPSWLTHAFRDVRKLAGVPGVRFHDLRHWFATSALQAGVALNDVSRLLGHTQTSTTLNTYGHAVHESMRSATEGVSARLKLPDPPELPAPLPHSERLRGT